MWIVNKYFLLILVLAPVFAVYSSAKAQTAQTKSDVRAEPSVLSFQAWKTSRIEEAKATLALAEKGSVSAAAPAKGAGKKSDLLRGDRLQTADKNARSDQKIQQAHTSLEIVQELTVNDYFVLYLSQFRQKEAFLEAAKKMNADEAADLMMAYQKHLGDPDQEDGTSAAGAGLVRGSIFK